MKQLRGLRDARRYLQTGFLAAVALVATSVTWVQAADSTGSWIATGTMPTAHVDHTATLLLDGKVLVAGGFNTPNSTTASAELYNPSAGTWTATGSMTTRRFEHAATLLQDGTVLVAGGVDSTSVSASAEIYHPRTGTWSPTGSMNVARRYQTATVLQDGRVLVTGGLGKGGSPKSPAILSSAELYDPRTGTWTVTGSMNTPRFQQTATLLPDGDVLVVGGMNAFSPAHRTASAELYNPNTGRWTTTSRMSNARAGHSATLLLDGKVLVAGGSENNGTSAQVSAELYDPATGTWTATGSMNTARTLPDATLLGNGDVLLVGGVGEDHSALATAELYDPQSGLWHAAGDMSSARLAASATLLRDGDVLVAGGQNVYNLSLASALRSSELFTP